MENILQSLFCKKFTIKSTVDKFHLPLNSCDVLFSSPVSPIQSLLELKVKSNCVKESLSDKDIALWHSHTTFTNPTCDIMSECRKRLSAEFCTQAWVKFYEILCRFREGLIPNGRGRFLTIHLCEAPGAFVSALNHFLYVDDSFLKWEWYATTLNPYNEANSLAEMIADDRLMLNTLPHWLFGDDNTGNLCAAENLNELIGRFGGQVDLVTADGSRDCQNDPCEQEAFTFPLHYCEMVAALNLLKVHGSFVLKLFTTYEHCTISLLYLLSCLFEEVHLFKPATSKGGNSECYLICERFTGAGSDLLDRLTEFYGLKEISNPVIPLDCIPQAFIDRVAQCAEFFTNCQIQMIQYNLSCFNGDKTASDADFNKLQTILSNGCNNNIIIKTNKDGADQSHTTNAFSNRSRDSPRPYQIPNDVRKCNSIDRLYKTNFRPGPSWTKPEALAEIQRTKAIVTEKFFGNVYRSHMTRPLANQARLVHLDVQRRANQNAPWFSPALLSGNRFEGGTLDERTACLTDPSALRKYLDTFRAKLTQFSKQYCGHGNKPAQWEIEDCMLEFRGKAFWYEDQSAFARLGLRTVNGRRLRKINSSRFVDVNLWRMYAQFCEIATEVKLKLPERLIEERELCSFLVCEANDMESTVDVDATCSSSLVQSDCCHFLGPQSKSAWLSILADIFHKSAQPVNGSCGRSVVLKSNASLFTLTRFSVGLIALLAACFRRVRLSIDADTCQITFTESVVPNQNLLPYLKHAQRKLSETSSDQDMLELLPMSCFVEHAFYAALISYNSRLLIDLLLKVIDDIAENKDSV